MSIYILFKLCATTTIIASLADMLVTQSIQKLSILPGYAYAFRVNDWSQNVIWKWLGLLIGRNTLEFMGSRALFFPIAEIIFPLSLITSLYLYGSSPLILPNIVFSIFIILIFVIDLRTGVVPNVISVPGIILGILLGLVRGWQGLLSSFLGTFASFLFYAFLYYFGKLFKQLQIRRLGRDDGEEALGAGVVVAGIMTGAFCGWPLAWLAFLITLLMVGIHSYMLIMYLVVSGRYKSSALNTYVQMADIVVLGGAFVMFVLPFFPNLLSR